MCVRASVPFFELRMASFFRWPYSNNFQVCKRFSIKAVLISSVRLFGADEQRDEGLLVYETKALASEAVP